VAGALASAIMAVEKTIATYFDIFICYPLYLN